VPGANVARVVGVLWDNVPPKRALGASGRGIASSSVLGGYRSNTRVPPRVRPDSTLTPSGVLGYIIAIPPYTVCLHSFSVSLPHTAVLRARRAG